jgi:hypothetical protein
LETNNCNFIKKKKVQQIIKGKEKQGHTVYVLVAHIFSERWAMDRLYLATP